MLHIERNRYDLFCSNSLETIVLERVRDDHFTIVNIRVSIALPTGIITLHDTESIDMVLKLKTMSAVIDRWMCPESWLLQHSIDDQSDLHKLASLDCKSIATLSAMRTGESRIRLTFTDCARMCSIVISDTSYPHYDLRANMLHFLESLKTAVSSTIEQLEH